MSGYILTGGSRKEVKSLHTIAGGAARIVDKAYTLTGGNARLWYQRGTLLGSYAVGKTVKIAVGGKDYDWLVVHQGIPDAGIYDDSCDGTWLLMKDIYESRKWHSSNTNDYANSTIHSYLNSTFLNLLESNIKNAIKRVKIPYRKGSGASTTVTSGSNGLSAKIFLLSATETSFNFSFMPSGEGAELAYFKGCTDNGSDSKRVAHHNGSATDWWLRSPYCFVTNGAVRVDSNGGQDSNSCSFSHGMRPALILPKDVLVDDTGHIIGTDDPRTPLGWLGVGSTVKMDVNGNKRV